MVLYSSISHKYGVPALRAFLPERRILTVSVNGICDICKLVLKRNVFEFNSAFFLQASGTAGTEMTQAYANILMAVSERDLLTASSYCKMIA